MRFGAVEVRSSSLLVSTTFFNSIRRFRKLQLGANLSVRARYGCVRFLDLRGGDESGLIMFFQFGVRGYILPRSVGFVLIDRIERWASSDAAPVTLRISDLIR
jgi:hypothetical protein